MYNPMRLRRKLGAAGTPVSPLFGVLPLKVKPKRPALPEEIEWLFVVFDKCKDGLPLI